MTNKGGTPAQIFADPLHLSPNLPEPLIWRVAEKNIPLANSISTKLSSYPSQTSEENYAKYHPKTNMSKEEKQAGPQGGYGLEGGNPAQIFNIPKNPPPTTLHLPSGEPNEISSYFPTNKPTPSNSQL